MVWVYKGRKFNVISESTAADIAARGVNQSDISVVHCGIDNEEYNFDPQITKYKKPTVLYLGRIKKYKSIDNLVVAFEKVLKEVPEAQLKIVGAGDYLPALKALAGKLKIRDRIDFPGFVSSEDKVKILRRSHVAVYPSLISRQTPAEQRSWQQILPASGIRFSLIKQVFYMNMDEPMNWPKNLFEF